MKYIGGMLRTSSTRELPWNRRQVYNSHGLSSTSTASSKSYLIIKLVQQCKLDVLLGGEVLFVLSTLNLALGF